MLPSFPIARIRRYREAIPDRLLVVVATAILSAVLSVAIFSPAGDPGLPIAVGLAGALALLSILSGIGRFAGLFAVVAVAIGAWDIFIGYGLGSLIPAVAFGIGVALAVSSNRVASWNRIDTAVLLIIAASAFPALVSYELLSIPGSVLLITGVYLAARFSRVSWSGAIGILLVVGAVHGLAALIVQLPGGESLIPIVPESTGAVVESPRAVGLYANPNTLGNVAAITLLLVAWSGARLWWLLAAPLALVGLVLSGSREALAGLALGLAVAAVMRRPWAAVGIVVVIGTTVFATTLLPELAPRLDPARFAQDTSLQDRWESWGAAMNAIQVAPWFGYGLERSETVIDQAYLGWLFRGGLIGAVLWVAGIGLLLVSGVPKAVLVAMLAIGFLADPFSGPTLIILVVVAGIAAAHKADHSSASPKSMPEDPLTAAT